MAEKNDQPNPTGGIDVAELTVRTPWGTVSPSDITSAPGRAERGAGSVQRGIEDLFSSAPEVGGKKLQVITSAADMIKVQRAMNGRAGYQMQFDRNNNLIVEDSRKLTPALQEAVADFAVANRLDPQTIMKNGRIYDHPDFMRRVDGIINQLDQQPTQSRPRGRQRQGENAIPGLEDFTPPAGVKLVEDNTVSRPATPQVAENSTAIKRDGYTPS